MTKHISTNGSEANGSSLELDTNTQGDNLSEKVTTLELQHCSIDLYLTGLELEKKVLKTYSRLLKVDKPFICSLSELVESIHYIDLAVHWSHQAVIVSLNYIYHEELFLKTFSNYREAIYHAIVNGNYTDSTPILDSSLYELKTPNEYVLENAYVDCDFSCSAFEKAFKFNNQLVKYGVRDKDTSTATWLYEFLVDLYYSGCLNDIETKAGKKLLKLMNHN